LVEALAEKAQAHGDKPGLMAALFGRETVPLLAAGGAPVNTDILLELDRLGIPVYQGYGLSENSSVATWNSRDANRIGTVGKPLAHVEVRISEEGELCLRSTSLFAGYSNEDPSSCSIDEDGWLHTGDLATQDDEGYISIVGRKKTMIITANGRTSRLSGWSQPTALYPEFCRSSSMVTSSSSSAASLWWMTLHKPKPYVRPSLRLLEKISMRSNRLPILSYYHIAPKLRSTCLPLLVARAVTPYLIF